MHVHRSIYSVSKERYYRTCTKDFPYPDPVKFKEQSPFAHRLVKLTELESETVKQEIFSHLSYRTTNGRVCSTAVSANGGVERTPSKEGRSKSARTRGIDTKGIRHERDNAKTTQISSREETNFPGTQSLFNLCTPSETSASDFELDMEPLSLGMAARLRGGRNHQ